MKEDMREIDYVGLFTAARMAYMTNTDLLIVGDKPALSKEEHAKIAQETDPIFAKAVKEYLPKILPYCENSIDVISTLSGLILIGEIKGIPMEAIPFLGRGVYAAPLFVDEEPEKVRELLDSINEKGYPQGDIRDHFFKKENRFGQFVVCAGILSGTALLQVFSDNPEKTRQLVDNYDKSEFFIGKRHV